jgi:hypothetical protein
MTFTNPIGVFGSYRYNDGFVASGSCSYPPRGFVGSDPSGCSFLDSNDGSFGVGPDTDMTLYFTGTINAQAGTVPEPSSVGMLASALLVFGWLHRKQTMPTRSTSSGYRRSVPLTTISILRLPHSLHTSRACQSGTAISAP